MRDMSIYWDADLPEPDDHAPLPDRVDVAVKSVLDSGLRTLDIHRGQGECVGTERMGDAVIAAL